MSGIRATPQVPTQIASRTQRTHPTGTPPSSPGIPSGSPSTSGSSAHSSPLQEHLRPRQNSSLSTAPRQAMKLLNKPVALASEMLNKAGSMVPLVPQVQVAAVALNALSTGLQAASHGASIAGTAKAAAAGALNAAASVAPLPIRFAAEAALTGAAALNQGDSKTQAGLKAGITVADNVLKHNLFKAADAVGDALPGGKKA